MNILIFTVAVLWLVVVALIVTVVALARQVGILFERVTPVGAMINDAGPRIGDQTPRFQLASLTGGDVVIGGSGARSTLVFFLSPSCPICKKLLPALKSVRASEANWLDVVLASDGEEKRQRAFIRDAGLEAFPYVVSESLGVGYRVSRLPFAVLIDGSGVIRAKGLINSREQLESLFNAVETGYVSIQDYAAAGSVMAAGGGYGSVISPLSPTSPQ